MPVTFTIESFTILLLGAAVVLLVIALAALIFFQQRSEDRWRRREEVLRDQLWVKSGGTKPQVKFEHEKIVKVPDPEARPEPANWRDTVIFSDEIIEEIEHELGLPMHSLSPDQAKTLYPNEWRKYEQQLQAGRQPLKA